MVKYINGRFILERFIDLSFSIQDTSSNKWMMVKIPYEQWTTANMRDETLTMKIALEKYSHDPRICFISNEF